MSWRRLYLWLPNRPVGLTKSEAQTQKVKHKGQDWVESMTKTHSYLLPELRPLRQPVAKMVALLVMSTMQIMQ